MSELGSYELMDETAKAWLVHTNDCEHCSDMDYPNWCGVAQELDVMAGKAEDAYRALAAERRAFYRGH